LYVKKKSFAVPAFEFETGTVLPITAGYETYGTLNKDRTNAILICHYFSGTSHAGGEGYTYLDSNGNIQKIREPGWWAPIIGPGLAFDTNHYFIICMDVFSNVNVNNPHVITTGPATIDSTTGQPYGLNFPQVTIRDMVRLQKMLLDSLSIEHLVCVAGPSMGGMQALRWAVDYPDAVDHVIAIVSTGRTSAFTSITPLQLGIDAILANKASGIHTAIKAMTIQAYSYTYTEQLWPHEVGQPALKGDIQSLQFHKSLNDIVHKRVDTVDPYHWLYISRACQLYTLESGYESLDTALSRIKAKVLAIPSVSDLIFAPSESRDLVNRLNHLGKTAYYREWASNGGHIEAITGCTAFSTVISEFLEGQEPSTVI
jgi:homoserine O-acetyltransferase